jgi:phosphinothricin acetyltransferase
LRTGLATFETAPKPQEAWESDSIPRSAIVAVEPSTGNILGWATLWPTSNRAAYAGVAEVSLYVGTNARRQGVGKVLLNALVSMSEKLGIWTLQAGIFEENTLSVSLHQKCDFRIVGTREKIGVLNGEWKNVVLMERRSTTVGV